MFKSGNTYRHLSCTEIDIYVVQVNYRGPNYYKMKVLYINRQAVLEKNKIIDNRPQTVKIQRQDFDKWSVV